MISQRFVDRYEISAELGRGGMGVVYRARDPRLNRDVAIKLIPPSYLSPQSEQRFQREAQLVAQMDHPAIVSIYDFGRHDGSLFFVMPLVQGTNLREFLRHDSLLGDVVDIAIQVAEALEYSHARGVVHRDIKPDNIMVSRDEGAGVRVRVMDFGLARAAAESKLTKTGTLVGTLSYLSPEQVVGGEIDGRSDIYALGTVLYECVVGEPPFLGEAQSVVYRIVHEFPQSPRSQGANIDEDLEHVILACLVKEPGKRLQRAGEVAEALKRYRSRLHDSDRTRAVTGFTRTFQAQRPALAPFIGRVKEFAELQQRLNAAISGECQFVVVAGEPGIGKTRLLDELETLARARQIQVLHGRSVEQDRAFPYQGFCEIIQEFFRLRETGTSPLPDFSDLATDLVSLFPMLNEIREIRSAATGESKLSRGGSVGPENRTQVFELLARALTRLAGAKPLVLYLEDLHQAEVSIEALQYVVRRLGPTPTLIVGTYRTTEVDSRHPLARTLESFRGDRRFASLTLGPFSASEHRSFLETLVGTGVSVSLVERLFRGSEGNPFFTKELVRSLLDSGGITKDDSGSWNLSAEAETSADVLPATIQQAVEKRIERLPDELREVLSLASVIGKSFDARDLASLTDNKSDTEDALDRLLQEGLVEEERQSRGDVLAFSSGVVRDVLYAALSRRKRRSLHRKYAELLETRHAGRVERVLPQLVHHFSQGDVPEKTVEYGLGLARSSLDAFSAEEAIRAARTALEFLDEEWTGDPVLQGEARLSLARALRMAGDVDGALREALAAIRVFERDKQPARAVGSFLLAAEVAWQARRADETERWIDKGMTAARAAGEPESLRQFLLLRATLANLQGDYERATAYLEEAGQIGHESNAGADESRIPQGGRLVVALANPVKPIEPTSLETNEEAEIAAVIFETLIATDSKGNLIPWLCEKWEVSDRGRRFLLSMRPDVRFSDDHPVMARDVKASFEASIRLCASDMPAAFAAMRGFAEYRAGKTNEVGGIVVQSDTELEVQLTDALPIYPALLTEGSTGILRLTTEAGAARPRLLGTGPYVLASQDAERLILERNRSYWRTGFPRLDAIEFRPSLTAAAIARAFRAGELDLARDLLPEDLEELLRDPRFRQGLVESPKKNTYFALFNLSGPASRHQALRRALTGTVRARDLVWRTLGRFAEPAVCLIPPGMLGHDPGKRSRTLSREEALEMMRSVGIEANVRLKASVHPLFLDRYASLFTALCDIWRELGVTVDVETSTMTTYLDSWKHSEGFDLMIGRWNSDYDDPDNFTHTLFHAEAGVLRRYFSSAEADQILDDARSESRPAVREALYRKFEGVLTESGALVPLFHDIDYRLASPQVAGLTLRGTAPYVNYTEVGRADAAEHATESRRTAGGILQVPVTGVVSTLDPALLGTVEDAETLPNLFESLTRDAGGARIVPWLVSEFRAEDGGRKYRFRLRDDVRFHDGRRLSARDVRYSYERLLKLPESDTRWLYSAIKGAKAVLAGAANDLAGFRIHSASEFTIELEEPVVFFPALLAYCGASIIPEGSDPSRGRGAAGCAGTGPFRVVAFEPNRRLELERNKQYWRKGYPRSEGLVFTFGTSPKDILSGFRAGRFSIASDLFPSDVEALRREPDFASGYHEAPRLITYFAALNAHQGPLTDRALRQRVVGAVDVPRMIRQTLGRLAIPAASLIPPGLLSHEATQSPQVGPSGSLQAAGKPASPIELTAAIHPVFFGGYSAVALEVSSALEKIGLRVRPVNKTMAEFLEAERNSSVDLYIGRWAADYLDPDTFAHILQTREGHLGRLSGSPELDHLIERGRSETIPAIRHSLYREIEETLRREALLLPLFHEQVYRFARPEVEGLSLGLGLPAVPYENLRIRE